MTILEQLFTWTLRASWHASILVVVVLLIQQLFRKQLTATWRHALWFAILIRLAIPTMPSSPLSALNLGPKTPPLELPRSYRPPSIEPTFAQNLTTSTFVKSRQGPSPILESSPPAPLKPIPNKASEHSDLSSFEILSITWISIAMLLLVRVAVRNQRFAKSLNCDCADQLPHLGVPFRKAKKTLGIDHFQLRLSTSHQVKSPCIFGLLHPTLLIPVGLDKGLSATELECVFLHELAHLKRKDIAFSWIMCLLQCLHWFNPFVWFAMNRIRIDRELATDETVLKHASENQRHCYGELIIKLLDQWRRPTTRPAGVVGMVESKRDLSNRIRAIAKYSRSHRTPVLGLAIAACTILIFMLEADAPSSLQIEEVSNITVTVLADRSDKFISNSRVEVRNFSWNAKTKKWDKENKAVQNGATDTQGQALIEGILSHAGRYKITATHPDYAPNSINIDTTEASLPPEADIYLQKDNTIGGFVTDPSGQAIQNVTVEISYPRPGIKVSTESPGSIPTTDQNGYWSFVGVSEETQEVFVNFRHPQYALPPTIVTNKSTPSIRFIRYKQTSMAPLRSRTDLTILRRGTQFQGRVLNEYGEPIPKAKIRIEGHVNGKPIETNEDGSFISKDTFAGELKVIITASGQAPEIFIVHINEDSKPQDFQLSPGYVVHLKFIDSKGTPIGGVRIIPQSWQNVRINNHPLDVRSDRQGLYQWNEAPKEPVRFSISKENYYQLGTKEIPTGKAMKVITMYRKPTVTIEVTDQSGHPIQSFSAQQGQPNEFFNSWSNRDTWTGSNGKITIGDSSRNIINLDELPSYVYRVEAKGYHSKTTRIVTAAEENIILRIQLEPVPEVRHRLELPSGEGLGGRRLYLLSANSIYSVSENSLALEAGNDEEILTDQNGEFETPNREKSHFLLGLLPEGFFLEPVDQRASYKLTPWGSLRGTWREDGQPTQGLEMGFTLRQRPGENSPNLHFVKRVLTDRNGEFTFDRVPARIIDILHSVSSGRNKDHDHLMASLGGATSFRFEKSVKIDPGQEAIVNLDHTKLRTLRGKIEVPEELRSKIEIGPSSGMLEPDGLKLPIPESLQDKPIEMREWYIQWMRTDEGQQYHDNHRNSTCLNLDENGSFNTHSMAPGKYKLSFTFREKTTSTGSPRTYSAIAQVIHHFEITASSPLEIDLGSLRAVESTQERLP